MRSYTSMYQIHYSLQACCDFPTCFIEREHKPFDETNATATSLTNLLPWMSQTYPAWFKRSHGQAWASVYERWHRHRKRCERFNSNCDVVLVDLCSSIYAWRTCFRDTKREKIPLWIRWRFAKPRILLLWRFVVGDVTTYHFLVFI